MSAGPWKLLCIREAIASVSMSHAQGCACDICRAEAGDIDALARIVVAVTDAQDATDAQNAPPP